VTGISWDGVPTTGNLSAQNPFFIQPYVYSQGQTLSSLSMSSGLVLSGDTITASGSLTNDIFTGSNTIQGGTVTITGSQITGTLNVNSAKLTLVDVSGGNIVASGSSVTLLQSGIGNLTLTSSTVNIEDSSYQSISPSVLTLQANGVPTQPISGTANITITATGQDCNSLAISVDGNKVGSYSGAVIKLIVNASALADGVHSLQATATQTDGLSSSATWYFSTNAHLVAQDNALNSAQSTLQSTNSTLSNTQKNLTTTTDILYVALVIAVIALVVAAVALVRKPKAQEWHPPSPSS